MNRRQFCLGSMALVGLSACVTQRVWEDVSHTKYQTYNDRINAFYISQDQRNFVILSERFHYIFTTTAVIPLLQSNLRSHYIVDIQNMHMTEPKVANELPISGRLQFALPISKLNRQELAEARQLGFEPVRNEKQRHHMAEVAKTREIAVGENEDFLVRSIVISGHRYQPKAGVSYGNSRHFYRQYDVPVSQEQTSVNAAKALGAAVVTPITLAADGVLMLFGLPLFLILIYSDKSILR